MAIATIDLKALSVARMAERSTRNMGEQKRHDRIVAAVKDAGFGLEIAIRAAWEALAE
jgi:transcription-repair coupling factor (superfamily II helicase)